MELKCGCPLIKYLFSSEYIMYIWVYINMSYRKPILRSPEGFLQTSVALVGLFVVEFET